MHIETNKMILVTVAVFRGQMPAQTTGVHKHMVCTNIQY